MVHRKKSLVGVLEEFDNNSFESEPLTGGSYDLPDTMVDDTSNKNKCQNTDNEMSNSEHLKRDRGPCSSNTDIRCSFFYYSPDFLQYCNNPKALLAFLCCFCLVQGFVVSGINNVNTSTIERRFELSSSKVGTISSAYDVSAAILGIVISYFGSGQNKSRLLAISALMLSLGSFLMALPHFTTEPYQWGQNTVEKCKDPSIPSQCITDTRLQNYLYVFILGQVLHGVAGTTLYIVGVSFLDDSVPAGSSPMYIGIFYAFGTLGPALGYILGGQFLNIYVDYHVADSDGTGLEPSDPRWVGAWWIGFVCSCLLSLVIAVPLFGFGKELPSAKHVRDTRVSQLHGGKGQKDRTTSESNTRSLRHFLESMWAIVSNPTFLLVTLAGTGAGTIINGFATFMPKFIRNQFGITASLASVLAGLVSVPGAAGGQFIGGLVCKRWNLKVQGMLKVCFIISGVVAVLTAHVWIRCPEELVAGVNKQYSSAQNEILPQLVHQCNSNCSCSTEFYEPVCFNEIQYFSPCHAGCLSSKLQGQTYTNCSCMHSQNPIQSDMTVTVGRCETECYLMYIFLPLLLFNIFFRFVQSPCALSATLRYIRDDQRTFALGIQMCIGRLLGAVPGPLFFGALIDSACLVWQENDCGDKKSCYVYDNASLSRNFFILGVCFDIFITLMYVLAYKVYKPPVDMDMTKTIKKPDNLIGVATIS